MGTIHKTYSLKRLIQQGVPQGAVLSSTLFILYCYDIQTACNGNMAMFADDTCLFTQNADLFQAITDLQTCTTLH